MSGEHLSPIPADLAAKVKKEFGWDFPIDDGTKDPNAVEIPEEDMAERPHFSPHLPADKNLLSQIPADLAEQVKRTLGWDFPTIEDSEET
jgi:hypothetical protein